MLQSPRQVGNTVDHVTPLTGTLTISTGATGHFRGWTRLEAPWGHVNAPWQAGTWGQNWRNEVLRDGWDEDEVLREVAHRPGATQSFKTSEGATSTRPGSSTVPGKRQALKHVCAEMEVAPVTRDTTSPCISWPKSEHCFRKTAQGSMASMS